MMARKSLFKFTEHISSIAGAIEDAWNTLEDLASEMREAFDNTPESLQQSGVGEARGEAADALEALSQPDVPDFLDEKFQVSYKVPTKQRSRRERRDAATGILSVVVDELQALLDVTPEDSPLTEDQRGEVLQLQDEVQSLLDEADGVSFPGMYG